MKKLLLILLFLPLITLSQIQVYEDFLPSTNFGTIYHKNYFSLSFHNEYKIPEWTIHILTKDRLRMQKVKRVSSFTRDNSVQNSPDHDDYRYSGYDRGHLVPAADMSFDSTAMRECFYMSNISPQLAHLNRGIWKRLEYTARNLVSNYANDSLIIITGTILSDNVLRNTINNNIVVPKYYYKIIVDMKRKKAISFIIPNSHIIEDSPKSLMSYCTSIDQIESLTGVDFFSNFNDTTQEKLEGSLSISIEDFLVDSYNLDYDPIFIEDKGHKIIPERKLALIIGISNYNDNSLDIKNPKNDAKIMDVTLRSIGFETILKVNLDNTQIRESISSFKEMMKNYDFGIFYYAGHGVSFKGVPCLIARDYMRSSKQKEDQYLSIDQFSDIDKNKELLIILDACRTIIDNKYRMSPLLFYKQKNIRLAMSTRLGKKASDNDDINNSLYTYSLAKWMTHSDLSIENVFDNTWHDLFHSKPPLPSEIHICPINDECKAYGHQSPQEIFGDQIKDYILNPN
jgi:endonuclease G, mitochondrial